ncbi:MAG: hypothetical protein HYW27_00730 [Candidatus Aenigmarchaeota archaeon]|nr:hypothetical protein [Candidatus Aenigmarchaeota archaeon]
MPVVRIDEKLLREIKDFLKRDENRYRYPSVAAFINNDVFEKLKDINEKRGKKNGSP